MNAGNKRKDMQQGDNKPKRVKKECDYGERCYRRNPAHFREFSHRHLKAILDTYPGTGPYNIPNKYSMDEASITEQLDVIVEKQLYTPWIKGGCCPAVTVAADASSSTSTTTVQPTKPQEKNASRNTADISPSSSQVSLSSSKATQDPSQKKALKGILKNSQDPQGIQDLRNPQGVQRNSLNPQVSQQNSETPKGVRDNSPSTKGSENSQKAPVYPLFKKSPAKQGRQIDLQTPQWSQHNKPNPPGVQKDSKRANTPNGESSRESNAMDGANSSKPHTSDYRPIVPPTRRAEDFLNVVVPKGKMATKHAASAPYYIFYTTITAAKDTHNQPYSITFQEILDSSLGELKCSLQINFMVELGWLLAQYYFAGYSQKKLTILYGEDSPDLQTISQKKPHVDAHMVRMATPFGKHHTKMMILCYEDGSLRVVVSTANLYLDDWENRTQGLWLSPRCPELPTSAMPHEGDSPTMFKRSLLRYLNHYQLPALTQYVERVKRCDFSHINVFLVASVPGSHFDMEWGMTRVGTLLRQHCAIPASETRQWPLLAQASSIGSFGKDPSLWLTGDFLHHFTKIKDQPQTLSSPAALKLIYPSLENVQRSHDGLLGGGCLPYAAAAHSNQPWLNDYLYQWRAISTRRDRAMPHIKCYTRVSADNKRAAYLLLTSGNVSKAAWGSINKGNSALRIMSYEAGVLFLPTFIIKEDFFPLEEKASNRLVLPYDVPPIKYTRDMSPWVQDYLMG